MNIRRKCSFFSDHVLIFPTHLTSLNVCKNKASGGGGEEAEALEADFSSFVLKPFLGSCQHSVLGNGNQIGAEFMDGDSCFELETFLETCLLSFCTDLTSGLRAKYKSCSI